MSNRIIYTTIFDGYDEMVEQNCVGWDWRCFSEENSIPLYSDNKYSTFITKF